MTNLLLKLRTRNNLQELLKNGESPAWVVAPAKEAFIKQVEIYNWDGNIVLRGDYDSQNSYRRFEDNRLVVCFKNARIELVEPAFKWSNQNPVSYSALGDESLSSDDKKDKARPPSNVNEVETLVIFTQDCLIIKNYEQKYICIDW